MSRVPDYFRDILLTLEPEEAKYVYALLSDPSFILELLHMMEFEYRDKLN